MSDPYIPFTTGGAFCSVCNQWYPHGSIHYCAGSPPASNLPDCNMSHPVYGWTCPVCGNGLAPWVSVCPHPRSGYAASTDGVAGPQTGSET